jgi:2-succinyl-5-enolpyruvyl-6-hydroxy-3-cyclohexene-1-carboxylate synthase
VLTDICSNQIADSFIRASDDILSVISENDMGNFCPELLITFGGQIISKKLKVWLREHPPLQHWHVNAAFEAPDTYRCLTKVIASDIHQFLNELVRRLSKINSTYSLDWHNINISINIKRNIYLEETLFSDFKVSGIISKHIPSNSLLHIANSMPIRYAQFLSWPSDVQIQSNRGVSGIEGCISTAVGAAMLFHGFTTIISGHLAMLYDSHSLWNNHLPKNLRIIVINNEGGGIFRIIDGPGKHTSRRDYFETPHHLTLKYLADMYHVSYMTAKNEKELGESLSNLYKDKEQAVLLEILTDQEINAKVFNDYFKYINIKKD